MIDAEPIPSCITVYRLLTGNDPYAAGRRIGKEIVCRCVRPQAHSRGDADPSFNIDPKQDVWTCRSESSAGGRPVGGKALDMIVHAGRATDRRDALRWLRDNGAMPDPPISTHAATTAPDSRPRIDIDDNLVAKYAYRDEAGVLLYGVKRYEALIDGRREKRFVQGRVDRDTGWAPGLNGVRRVPYRLPELRKAAEAGESVIVVEGEKLVDDLRKHGRTATTNSGGAGWHWTADFVECFGGILAVSIIVDCDVPGRAAAARRASLLQAIAPQVRIVDLAPDRNDGYDVFDWLEEGHSVKELDVIIARTTPLDGAPSKPEAARFVTFADLQNEPEEQESWLIEDLLPMGGTSMLVAKPKVGKSVTAQNLALSVARGEPFLGRQSVRGPVLYLALEEKRGEIRRHFEAMGTQPSDDNLFFFIAPSPADALEWLALEAKKRKPVLIIIDTLQRLLRIADLNDYAKVVIAMEPLVTLARQSGAHLLLAHHGKKSGGDNGDAVLGSTGLFGSVDTLLEMRRSDTARTIRSTQRYGVDLEETVLAMDPATFRINLAGSRADFDEERVVQAILDYLEGQPDPPDRRSIIDAVEGRAQVKHGALRRLLSDGRVDQTGSGKKGDPYRYTLSSSLVPNIYREPPEPQSENAEKANKIRPNAGSRNSSICDESGTGIAATRNHLLIQQGSRGEGLLESMCAAAGLDLESSA